jgi:hypothetical protein
LKEAHVIVLVTRESQHFMQWQQRCHKLHHGFLCVHCHEHNIKGGYTHQKILAIEGCDNPSCVQNVVGKNGEDNQNVGKIGQVVS